MKKIIEAALFMSSDPIPLDQLSKISGVNSLGHLKEMLEDLQKEYAERGMNINCTPDGWIMSVRQDILPTVAHLTPYSDLSEGHKRTLALVAYKEPVMQSELIKMQGNKAYSYIKDLTRRDLLKSEKKGHTKILALTGEFERYFGEEKAKIKEKLKLSAITPEPAKPKMTPEEYQFAEGKKERKAKVRTAGPGTPNLEPSDDMAPPAGPELIVKPPRFHGMSKEEVKAAEASMVKDSIPAPAKGAPVQAGKAPKLALDTTEETEEGESNFEDEKTKSKKKVPIVRKRLQKVKPKEGEEAEEKEAKPVHAEPKEDPKPSHANAFKEID